MIKLKNFLLALLIFTTTISSVAFAQSQPNVSASAAILMEKETGRVLYTKNADAKMFPASMTKILTAMVLLDYFDSTTLITVGREVNTVSLDSSKAGHTVDESITVENLVRGLIIPSGNDTATVVASAVAKKAENNVNLPYEECEVVFSKLMNEKAKELGATNTHFTNPHGYHDDNHYTTATDMAIITAKALENEVIAKIASETSFTGNGAGAASLENSATTGNNYSWKSHNLLITSGEYYYENATGMKTGFTNEAGDCVAATAQKDGVDLIAVIFNSPDGGRWTDAKNLFEYGFNNYSKTVLQSTEAPTDIAQLQGQNKLLGSTVSTFINQEVSYYLSTQEESNVNIEIQYNADLIGKTDEEDGSIFLKAPLTKDQEIGSVKYSLNGEVIAERTLYSGEDIEKSTIISSISYFFVNLGGKIFTLSGLISLVVIIVVILIILLIIKMIIKRRQRGRYQYKYKMPRR